MEMPGIVVMSAYETSAERFFETLRSRGVDLVLDVRLRNTNQLCGFTKRGDLAYLVPALTGAAYVHDEQFAPSDELLGRYVHGKIGWEEYAREYRGLMGERGATEAFRAKYGSFRMVALLGTGTRKRRSHAEALEKMLGED
ncbi:MAG: DUF488 domain-containing protein [Atopobiaceae bacterium]|jgi:hypothetical protein|nr:DUF488 domain-containing protein [Atopobiaceae bacterium]